jgi:hypothetical protein
MVGTILESEVLEITRQCYFVRLINAIHVIRINSYMTFGGLD